MKRAGWYKVALEAIERISRRQRFMTSDDLWDEVPYDPPNPNGIGAVMRKAQEDRTIETTGRIAHSSRPNAKGRMVQVWESCQFTAGARDDELEEFVAERERRAQADPNQGALSL